MNNPKDYDLLIEPSNPGGGEIFAKILIGIIIGIIVSFAIFLIMVLVGGMFKEAFQNIQGNGTVNPLLPFVLILIAFISTIIGNIVTVGIYNFFMPNKYYDLLKMFSLVLVSNILLFFIVLPLYILFFNSIINLFFILAFHIMFSVYISISILEFFTNPNYSGAYMIGSTFGFALCVLCFGAIYKMIDINNSSNYGAILISPSLLAYGIIPIVTALWQKIYFKFYQAGNNFLYIPSLNEVMIESDEVDDINVNIE